MSTQPVGLSTELAPKQVMRARLESADLAIWRSASGVISAWENRCPHSGMRLSHGFVRGESLACAYHGWHYGCDGGCNKIPAHPELAPPETIKVTRYNVKEHCGLVWVNTIDDVQPVSLPDNLKAVRSLTINCTLQDAVEGFSSLTKSQDASLLQSVTTVSKTPTVLSFSSADATDCVWIAFQPSPPISTVCHVLGLDTMTGTELVNVSRWCEAARRVVEKSAENLAVHATTNSNESD